MCVRKSIDVAEELIAEAGKFAHGRTKKAIVEEALRSFVQTKSKEAGLRSYGERLRELESRTASLSLRESPAELLRADRDHRATERARRSASPRCYFLVSCTTGSSCGNRWTTRDQ